MQDNPTLEVLPAILRLACDHRHPLTSAGAKLAIEIDGDSHAESEQEEYDKARTRWLEEAANKVIRIMNEDVHVRLEDALKEIYWVCQERSAALYSTSKRNSL